MDETQRYNRNAVSRLTRQSPLTSWFRPGLRCTVTLMLLLALTLATAHYFDAQSFVSTTHAMNDEVHPKASGSRRQTVSSANLQTTYVGASSLTQSLRDNQAQPLTLASADFDEDGMPDLIAGYATSNGGGIVTIQRGNVHALFPYGDAVREGEPPAFLPTARVFALPEAPDFLGAGDFDADGHWDVVAAKRGSSALFFLQGDRRGGLRAAERTELLGRVTALTTGEINRRDGLTDIIVGTDGPGGARALVFESPGGAIRGMPEAFNLEAAAASFALGQFVGDYQTDLAVAADNDLLIVGGRDRRLTLKESVEPAVTSSRQLPFLITGVVAGNFTGDFEGELAPGSLEGQVEIIAVYGKTFSDTQFNPAFVQMEYFGYMRRNEDTAGFNFWLDKLNFYGDFITAEMVRSFLLSPEYRRRFGSQ